MAVDEIVDQDLVPLTLVMVPLVENEKVVDPLLNVMVEAPDTHDVDAFPGTVVDPGNPVGKEVLREGPPVPSTYEVVEFDG